MRKVVIAVVVIAGLFTAFMIWGGDRSAPQDPDKAPDPPPKLPAWVSMLGTLTSPFAPKLKLEGSPFMLDPSTPRRIGIATATERSRIARFRLSRGQAVRITLADNCKPPVPDDKSCPQDLCLVATAATTVPAECPQGGNPQDHGSVIATSVGGTLTLLAIGGPAEVEAK